MRCWFRFPGTKVPWGTLKLLLASGALVQLKLNRIYSGAGALFAPGPVEFLNKHRLTRCVCLAALAQLVEHLTCNHEVSGSIPGGGSTRLFNKRLVFFGEFPEWSNGADCKSVGSAFEGSNPPLPNGQ